MKKLLEYIQSINPAYKDTKFVSVIYHRGAEVLECKMVYDGTITDEDKSIITSAVKTYIGREVDVVVKLKKSILDKEVVVMLVNQYLKDNFASLYDNFDMSKIEVAISDRVEITIGFLPVFYDFTNSSDFKKDLLSYLENQFFAEFVINTYQYQGDTSLHQSLQKLEKQISDDIFSMDILREKRKIEVADVEKLVGELIENTPIAIADQTVGEEISVVAGKIQFLQKKTYKPKKASSDAEEKTMFSFQVRDYTGYIRCVAFPTQKTFAELETLEDGMEVVVLGTIDEFNGSKSMRVKQISTCKIMNNTQEKKEEIFVQKSCPKEYMHVTPEPYIIKKQVDLFSIAEVEPCQYLKDNSFVVFDLETTGLDYQTNSITEIGGIKIQNGKIVETFSTLVKPKEEISAEITKLTGITNSMVENQLPIEDIIGDFYKFCEGCVLVGHNIDFDYKFIFKAGRENGYLFDHKQQDTLFLAREYLKGMKNYKLGTIAEYLGVKLDNAHRAVFDALATAEVFIKLADNIK